MNAPRKNLLHHAQDLRRKMYHSMDMEHDVTIRNKTVPELSVIYNVSEDYVVERLAERGIDIK